MLKKCNHVGKSNLFLCVYETITLYLILGFINYCRTKVKEVSQEGLFEITNILT